MKYCVLIMDGAAGLPVAERGGKTSLEAARTPNLDALAEQAVIGLVKTVPGNCEPDSSVACMSIFGYDPLKFYRGRAPIEARSMGIDIHPGEVLFRCNLVTIADGRMKSHSAGGIPTAEAHELFSAVSREINSNQISLYPGTGYRSILKIKKYEKALQATCAPPHDIPGGIITDHLPQGEGSELLNDLISRSQAILQDHPVNRQRIARGLLPANSIWLFWGSGKVPLMPPFSELYGKTAAVTSGVALLRGLAAMANMQILEIPGVTDGMDNDYERQIKDALNALEKVDLVLVHVEAPDEAGHAGSAADKITAIEKIDTHIVSELKKWQDKDLRVLIMPDHPTPVTTRVHTGDPVPFLLWGKGVAGQRIGRFTEQVAKNTGELIDPGWHIMRKLIGE